MKDKNENRRGYKKTEVGWIPEEWEFSKLKDVAQVITGPFGAQLHRHDYVNDGTPIVTVEHLSVRGIVHENLPLVSEKDKCRLARYILKKGDIVFSRVGSVDRNSLITDNEDGWLFSGRLLRVRPNLNSIYPLYISGLFGMQTFKNHMVRIAVGGTMACLNTSLLSGVFIILPPLPEQKAIASVLECWDNAIQKYEEKIEKKKNIKKGLMQRLLTGEQRLLGFDGEWETKRLGELGLFSKGKGISRKDISATGMPCIRYGEIYTTDAFVLDELISRIPQEVARQSKQVFQNELLFAGSGETLEDIGKSIAYMGSKVGYAGGDIIVFTPTNDSIRCDYLSYYMNTVGRSSIRQRGQGQSVVHVYPKHLQSITLAVPKIQEQASIVSVLSAADAEISALEKKVAIFRDQKKFLLNNLVTGTIRLPEFCGGEAG